MSDFENPGGMLSPDGFPSLESQNSGGGGWEQSEYSSDPAYDEVDSTAFSYVVDQGSGREQQVVTDGGKDVETLEDVDHTPPDWTDMDNPTI